MLIAVLELPAGEALSLTEGMDRLNANKAHCIFLNLPIQVRLESGALSPTGNFTQRARGVVVKRIKRYYCVSVCDRQISEDSYNTTNQKQFLQKPS